MEERNLFIYLILLSRNIPELFPHWCFFMLIISILRILIDLFESVVLNEIVVVLCNIFRWNNYSFAYLPVGFFHWNCFRWIILAMNSTYIFSLYWTNVMLYWKSYINSNSFIEPLKYGGPAVVRFLGTKCYQGPNKKNKHISDEE